MRLIDIRTLSEYIGIKPKTLYSWAALGKIPSMKIHGVLRFDREEIDSWLMSFKKEVQQLPSSSKGNGRRPYPPEKTGKPPNSAYINNLVSKAIQSPYNRRRRETRPSPSPKREAKDGAV